MARFDLRVATPEDAPAAATILARAFEALEFLLPGGAIDEAAFLRLIQTGSEFLVATRDDRISGAVRRWQADGIAWFDLLVSAEPGAGRALVRAIERWAQDTGARLVRFRCPDDGRLPELFGRWGYTGFSREMVEAPGHGPRPVLSMERRLPLLTVREQRRTDAAAIAALTGRDPWFFEQDARPGWFVAADGDRVIGAIGVRDAGRGVAEFTPPALLEEYRGRNLELWMIDRAAVYAETHGYHTARLPAATLVARSRDLEDRYWHREGDTFIRRFSHPQPPHDP